MYRTLIRTRTICVLYLRHAHAESAHLPIITGTGYYTHCRGLCREKYYYYWNTFSLSRGYKLVRSHYPPGPCSYQAVIPLMIPLIVIANCRIQTWRFYQCNETSCQAERILNFAHKRRIEIVLKSCKLYTLSIPRLGF